MKGKALRKGMVSKAETKPVAKKQKPKHRKSYVQRCKKCEYINLTWGKSGLECKECKTLLD